MFSVKAYADSTITNEWRSYENDGRTRSVCVKVYEMKDDIHRLVIMLAWSVIYKVFSVEFARSVDLIFLLSYPIF